MQFASEQNDTLQPLLFRPLKLGGIEPRGWLRDQLKVQANGLTGHLDEFWPSIAQSKWIGGEAEGWERGPYWLDGLIPLAVLLQDEPEGACLWDKASHWIGYILEHQHEDGWLGAKDDPHEGSGEHSLDPWPLAVLFKAFAQWHEATQSRGVEEKCILPAMSRALRRIDLLLEEKPLENWARMRWFEIALACLWLHERTGEAWLLELARKTDRQGFNWRAHFADFTLIEKPQGRSWTLESHGPNHAMALKEPALRFRLEGDRTARLTELKHSWAMLDRFHGQATGLFGNDECLSGRNPSQGAETCAVVEAMFSLEEAVAAFGDVALSDRLERLAFNALPAPFTSSMWARQYDQQVNQVVVSQAPRDFVSNGPESNLFSLEGEFGCCTANMHQGWPKFAQSLWMATEDGGLAAVAYSPCRVTAQAGYGTPITIVEETEYPFRDTVRFTFQVPRATRFALHLRVPQWCRRATLEIDGATTALEPGQFHVIEREWQNAQVILLRLPMEVRLEARPRNAVSVLRGPLLFGLKIGEEFRRLKGQAPHDDWEVHPTTPWNYALALNTATTERSLVGLQVEERPVSNTPFAAGQSPTTLHVQARRLPAWTLENHSAAAPPVSPVQSEEPLETVQLVPYGATHLRVAEFPYLAS